MSSKKDHLSEIRAKLAANITRVGWGVQAVMPGQDTRLDPSFAYTVGMTESLHHPELLMIGFHPDMMMKLINDVGALIRGGERFEDWSQSTTVIQNYPVYFRAVPLTLARHWAKLASERYRNRGHFQLLQMFLPDAAGKFPWDPDCDPKMARGQDHLMEAMSKRH